MRNGRKLHKAVNNRMLFGVCGGIAEFFNIDVTIVRFLIVVLTFVHGTGLLIYIIFSVIMPEASSDDRKKEKTSDYLEADSTLSRSAKKGEGPHSDEDFDAFFERKSKR